MRRDDRGSEWTTEAARERVYSSITGLVTVVILLQYDAETSPLSAAGSLAATMFGLFAASLVSDLVTREPATGDRQRRETVRGVLMVAAQALEVAGAPLAAVVLSATGLWSLRTGLVLAAAALILEQLGLVLWSARRHDLPWGRASVVVALQGLLIAMVVALKLATH